MHTVNTIKRMNLSVKARLEKNLNAINEFYKGNNSI